MPNASKWLRALHGVKLCNEAKARVREAGGRQAEKQQVQVQVMVVVVKDLGGCKISLDGR